MSQPGTDRATRLLRSAACLVFVEDIDDPQLGGEEAHHLLDVLRLRRGTEVMAADGHGAFRTCLLGAPTAARGVASAHAPGLAPSGAPRSRSPRRAVGLVLEVAGDVEQLPPVAAPIGVGFALAKGQRSEWIVQKLTELGTDEIWPLVTRRSVVRVEGDEARRRGDKLRRTAREAAAQSRRPRLPIVHDPVSFAFALDSLGLEPNGSVALSEPGGGVPSTPLRTVLVGPEGGWSEDELAGDLPAVALSDGVLRVETAALAAATLLAALRQGLVREAGECVERIGIS